MKDFWENVMIGGISKVFIFCFSINGWDLDNNVINVNICVNKMFL